MISEMFEIYKTDKLHGTGLGLPISRHFIEINHRGSIKFKQFTKHKIFTITLPIKQNAND